MAPNITEILYDLGVKERIVGVTDYCDYPPEAREKPKVGGFANPSLETLVAMGPDLVFLNEDGNPRELVRRLRSLGIETYLFGTTRIRDLPREIRAMGGVLGVGAAAEERAARLEDRLSRLGRGRQRPVQGNPKGIFIVQSAPLIAAGSGTVGDDALLLLGLGNVAATKAGKYPKFSLEEIVRLGPEFLFFSRGRGMQEEARGLLARLSFLEAVRQGRIFFVDETFYRLGPRLVPCLESLAREISRRGLKKPLDRP